MNIDWNRLFGAVIEAGKQELNEMLKEGGAELDGFVAQFNPQPVKAEQVTPNTPRVVKLPSPSATMTMSEISACHELLGQASVAEVAKLITAAQVRDWLKAHGVQAECEENGP